MYLKDWVELQAKHCLEVDFWKMFLVFKSLQRVVKHWETLWEAEIKNPQPRDMKTM